MQPWRLASLGTAALCAWGAWVSAHLYMGAITTGPPADAASGYLFARLAWGLAFLLAAAAALVLATAAVWPGAKPVDPDVAAYEREVDLDVPEEPASEPA